MRSQHHQAKHSSQNNLFNKILQALMQIQIRSEAIQEKYKANVEYLQTLNQQVQQLSKENKELTQIQSILEQCCQIFQADQKNINTSLIQLQNQPPTPSPIPQPIPQNPPKTPQISLPNLQNLQNYFTELLQQELIDKYLQQKMLSKTEELKHNEQVMRLQRKLEIVEENLNNMFVAIRNQRKMF